MRFSPVCGVCQAPKPGNTCRPCANRRNAEYKARNAEKVKASRSEYKKAVHAAGAEARAAIKAAKASSLAERRTTAKKKWKSLNPGAVNESTARRFAAKLRATPDWADRQAIQAIYEEAARLTKETGIEHHVDHIVPLRSKLVCGLHCEANLQILTAFENVSKNNRWWPDMPQEIQEMESA